MTRIRDIATFLAQTGEDGPTPAERALVAACVAGEFCRLGDGKRPEQSTPTRTVRAELLRALILGGDEGCLIDTNGVELQGAWITGPLDLSLGTATGKTGLINCCFTDHVTALQTRFDILGLNGSSVPGLELQGATVTGDVVLREGFHATGKVSLSRTTIGGMLSCSNGRFDNPNGTALDAEGMKVIGDVFLRDGFHAAGRVSLSGGSIGGGLYCNSGRFENPDSFALSAEGMKVTGDVFLREGFHATGSVSLAGTSIGGQLHCKNGRFENADGHAFFAQGMRVTEVFFWQGVTIVAGRVSLASAHVGDLADDLASWPLGDGQLYIDGFIYDRISAAFTDAPRRLEWLRRGTMWEGEFLPQPYSQLAKVLREMGHDSAARAILIEQRKLLGQAARRLRRQRSDGTLIPLMTAPDIALRNGVSQVIDVISLKLVGYGYRPWNAIYALIVLLLVAWGMASATWTEGSFAPNSAVILVSPDWTEALANDCIGDLPIGYTEPCDPNPADTWSGKAAPGMDWDSFNAAAYAVDLVVPILSLGQTDAWAPSKDRGDAGWWLWWCRWLLIAAGWFVTTLGVAALTGIIRRE